MNDDLALRMYLLRRPPVGLVAWARLMWTRARCRHTHVAALHPSYSSWSSKTSGGIHGQLVLCGCYKCGATFLRDYGA